MTRSVEEQVWSSIYDFVGCLLFTIKSSQGDYDAPEKSLGRLIKHRRTAHTHTKPTNKKNDVGNNKRATTWHGLKNITYDTHRLLPFYDCTNVNQHIENFIMFIRL
jgi:hypothetical protein